MVINGLMSKTFCHPHDAYNSPLLQILPILANIPFRVVIKYDIVRLCKSVFPYFFSFTPEFAHDGSIGGICKIIILKIIY